MNEFSEISFSAKMLSENILNKDRQFIIKFSLIDDEIKIWEIPTEGFSGGFYFKTSHIRNKNLPNYSIMFISSIININGINFEIINAPESTLQFMESQTSNFIVSDLFNIIQKISKLNIKKKLEEEFFKKDLKNFTRISLLDTKLILKNNFNNILNLHEI